MGVAIVKFEDNIYFEYKYIQIAPYTLTVTYFKRKQNLKLNDIFIMNLTFIDYEQ